MTKTIRSPARSSARSRRRWPSAAQLLHAAGHDVIDLNFACPVKKTAHARGGHMLSDVLRGIEIVKAVRGALPPAAVTTVSLRRSYDDSPAAAERFAELVEAIWANGYAAVRVHARTVVQKYQGRSRSGRAGGN
jgi:tRNA-dihydrouridine synthase